MNGEAEAMQNIVLSLPSMGVRNNIMDSEGAFDAWSKEYRSAWREEKHARMDKEASSEALAESAEKLPYSKSWSDMHYVRGTTLLDGMRRIGYARDQTISMTLNVFGGGGNTATFISNGKLKNAIQADVQITGIFVLSPDMGNGTRYEVSFFGPDGTQLGTTWDFTTPPGDGENREIRYGFPQGQGPAFNMNGGTINVKATLSDPNSVWGYDGCWNVGIGYNLDVMYR